MSKARNAIAVIVLLVVAGGSLTTVTGAAASTTSRGFNGTTIKVAGLGLLAEFSGADVGTQARFKRFNDTNEMPGIKIQYVGFSDDQDDPATALSDARQLVTQSGVFAIVPDLSPVNPESYLASQQVPYVGWAIDATYCSAKATTKLWGFGYDGCLVPKNPLVMPNSYESLYKYVSAKAKKSHPSVAIFSSDNQSGTSSVAFLSVSLKGAGFKVVSKSTIPMVVSDYTPYVQQWLKSNGGKAPDVLDCLVNTQCPAVLRAVRAAGFKGTFYQTLGPIPALAATMAGTLTAAYYNTQPNPGLTQMEKDLQAFKPGTVPIGYSNVPGYFAADMFIQALKKVGRNHITPEAVQKALSTIHWSIPGLVGPIDYPEATAVSTPACSELLSDSGTSYTVVSPYACTTKTFPVSGKS